MKDNFSAQSDAYARYRPQYPAELVTYIAGLAPAQTAAWDCGTGNGQLAGLLANFFEEVYATDISDRQVANAIRKPNIHYHITPAEKTPFNDGQFDLVTVAQAIHWFDFDAFYAEVKRTLRPGGIIAVIGYGLVMAERHLQDAITHFYTNIVGPYWDVERRYLDESYQTIPFPFPELAMPAFEMRVEWTRDDLLGYLNTWSAVQHYTKANGHNPVDVFAEELTLLWNNDTAQVFRFPLLLRVGRHEPVINPQDHE